MNEDEKKILKYGAEKSIHMTQDRYNFKEFWHKNIIYVSDKLGNFCAT
jgi:pyoverdine/dityrosine biosynthesis protein Dit1